MFDKVIEFMKLHPELGTAEYNELMKFAMDTLFKDAGRQPIETELTKQFKKEMEIK